MIACFEIEPWEEELVADALGKDNAIFFAEPLGEKHVEAIRHCDGIAVFIYSRVTKELLEKLPNLKFIATMSTGFDHIDVAACKARGVCVTNVPTYGDHTVSQHTFTLLLGLTRKLVASVEQVRKGDFTPSIELRGTDIHGKTIGVIGSGRIGRNVIKIAKGFAMDVLAYDPYPSEQAARELGFRYVPLDELYQKSDVITVHVPLNEHTKHLINKDAISKMKDGVIILNTSRGGIIETQALYDGLQSGKVSAAGLDVLEEETHIKEEKQLLSVQYQEQADYRTMLMNHALVRHPNVLVTPHNAFNSREALTRIITTTIDNIKAYQAGTCKNLVT